MSVEPRFDPHDGLTMRLKLSLEKYKQPQQWAAFFERLVEEIRAIPGVSAAAVVSGAPMEEAGLLMRYNIAGKPAPETKDLLATTEYSRVTPDYFRVLGMKLLKGRSFLRTDTQSAPAVAVVNEQVVKREFGGANPIGQRIILHGDVSESAVSETTRLPLEIIGVVNDTKEYGLYEITPPMI